MKKPRESKIAASSPRHIAPRKPPPAVNLCDDGDAGGTTDAKGREWPPIPDSALPRDIVLPRLEWVTKRGPRQWTACCPSHADSNPSLSITERPDGVLLLKCFSCIHCDAASICEAIGLSVAHLYPTPYALRCARAEGRVAAATPHVPAGKSNVEIDPKFKRLTGEHRRHPNREPQVQALAAELGVSVEALDALRVGWADVREGRWTIPERDHRRRVVGIGYRHPTGLRTSAKGGHRGLIIPRDLAEEGTVYLCEGMSDTAAMLSAGRCAIGRPSATVAKLVRAWLARFVLDHFNGRRVVIVGDRDEAGMIGARDLAAWLAVECGREVRWALPQPGYKDVREQWVSTGSVNLELQREGA